MKSLNSKIIVILIASLVLVEGVILLFTATDHRRELVDHYLFQSRIISLTADTDRLEDPAYRSALLQRLGGEKVLSVGSGPRSEEWDISSDQVLHYQGNGVTLTVDVSDLPGLVRRFVWNTVGVVAEIGRAHV